MTDHSGLKDLLAVNVPRYTSYPTANHFLAGAGPELAADFHSAIRKAEAVSVYIHIPYCDRMCWFCGCHTKQTRSYDPIKSYIKRLGNELWLLKRALGRKPLLNKLHLGGGSPSLLQKIELESLRFDLEGIFVFAEDAEISIEIDPTDLGAERIGDFASFGMTRASIGVQDFDPLVQQAINRLQSYEQTRSVVDAMRDQGIKSINIDMLYGLPFQTPERLTDTVTKVLSLSPNRIALFGYAHVPWMKPHQSLIPDAALPSLDQRLEDATMVANAILAAGYQQIGIDHFADPRDSLAKAAQAGKLRRNFQGYVADDCDVLIGLGASSISSFGGGYIQNYVATGRYTASVDAAKLPYDRGIAINEDDQARAWMIQKIMCDFGFRKSDLVARFNDEASRYWSLAEAVSGSDIGSAIAIDQDYFQLSSAAQPFARSIAARFDSRFTSGASKHSAAV